jgi:hypothetical protein
LRSARAARLPLPLVLEPAEAAPPEDGVDEEPIVLLEPVLEPALLPLAGGVEADDEAPELPLPEAPMDEEPPVEPVLLEPLLPAVALEPPLPAGVPVEPIGVFCELR